MNSKSLMEILKKHPNSNIKIKDVNRIHQSINHYKYDEKSNVVNLCLFNDNKYECKDISNEDKLFNSPIATYNILILCKGNTCRSIMLHSYLEKINPTNWKIFSAGTNVKSQKVELNTILNLVQNKIIPSKINTNSFNDYSDTIFDKIILLDKDIDLTKLKLNYNKFEIYDIIDPYGKELDFYKRTLEHIIKIAVKQPHS